MKKIIFFVIFLLNFVLLNAEVKVLPNLWIQDENWIFTKNSDFDKYRNRVNVQGGVNVKINDKYDAIPYVRLRHIDFKTDNENNWKNSDFYSKLKFTISVNI